MINYRSIKDLNEILDLMVKFDRKDVIEILPSGDNVEIKISGELTDGTKFEGFDYLKKEVNTSDARD